MAKNSSSKHAPSKGKATGKKAASSSGGSSLWLFVLGLAGLAIAGGVYLHQAGQLQPYLNALQESRKPTAPATAVDKPNEDQSSTSPDPPVTATEQPSVTPVTVEQPKATESTQSESTVSSNAPKKEEKMAAPKEDAKKDTSAEEKPKKKKKPVRLLQQSIGAKEPEYDIRQEVRAADRLLSKNQFRKSLAEFQRLLKQVPDCVRCKYGEAASLEAVAEEERSNSRLDESIQAYKAACTMHGARKSMRVAACVRQSDRLSFLGKARNAIREMEKAISVLGEETLLLEEISQQCLIGGVNDKGKKYLKILLKKEPNNGFALGHLGFVYKMELKYEEAVPLLYAGIRGDDDRSRHSRFYYHLGDALMRLNRTDESYEVYQEGAEQGSFNSMYQRSTYNEPDLTAQPWWTPDETPYAKDIARLEKNWKTIRDEGLAVLNLKNGGFDPEAESLRQKGDWGQFTLFQQGRMNEENCRKAPKTCKLVKSMRDAAGCSRGQIKYSVMQPGTVVWPHCGPTNCRLRFHLGLVVPDDVHIRCGNDTRTWQEGKTIVFDDSFEHEVWHHGKSFRMVLIIDFWHPDLSERQKQTLSPI